MKTNDKLWLAAMHLSPLLFFLSPFLCMLPPVILWVVLRSKNEALDNGGQQVINFQFWLSMYLVFVPAILYSYLPGFLQLFGPFLISSPLGMVLTVFAVASIIKAIQKTASGLPYEYLSIFNIFDFLPEGVTSRSGFKPDGRDLAVIAGVGIISLFLALSNPTEEDHKPKVKKVFIEQNPIAGRVPGAFALFWKTEAEYTTQRFFSYVSNKNLSGDEIMTFGIAGMVFEK